MDNLNKHIDLISKYLAAEANQEEIRELFNWIELDAANKKQFDEFKKTWELSETIIDAEIAAIDLDEEWSLFDKQISKQTDAKIIKMHPPKRKKLSVFQFVAVVAAVFVVGFGFMFLFNSQTNELVAKNKIIESSLPDGSIISLNTQSTLEYSKKFNKHSRKVELKGEAYFKVAHNPEKPFIIETGKLKIEVVGTEFNVNAKNPEGNVELIVVSGIVRVYTMADKSDSLMLYAGDGAVFINKQEKIQKKQNNDVNYLAWKTKKLVFENAELQDIVRTLNKTYSTHIVIKSAAIKKCKLSNDFEDQSLESILKVLKVTLDLKIKKEANTYVITRAACKK
jgi:ferric-dicitrate binding protein FerR (iron transport regulator)